MVGTSRLQDSTLCSQDIAVSRAFQSLFLLGEIIESFLNDLFLKEVSYYSLKPLLTSLFILEFLV